MTKEDSIIESLRNQIPSILKLFKHYIAKDNALSSLAKECISIITTEKIRKLIRLLVEEFNEEISNLELKPHFAQVFHYYDKIFTPKENNVVTGDSEDIYIRKVQIQPFLPKKERENDEEDRFFIDQDNDIEIETSVSIKEQNKILEDALKRESDSLKSKLFDGIRNRNNSDDDDDIGFGFKKVKKEIIVNNIEKSKIEKINSENKEIKIFFDFSNKYSN